MNQTQINPISEVTTKVAHLKPKKRGCSRCLSEAKQKLNRLCASCEEYVDQDKVSLTETLISGDVLEDRAEEAWDEVNEVFRDYTAEKQMVWPLLKKIGLSKQQRQVFFLHVCGQLTFEAISKCLRVSITTAKTQFQRFREKLRFCSPESQLVNTSSETSLIKSKLTHLQSRNVLVKNLSLSPPLFRAICISTHVAHGADPKGSAMDSITATAWTAFTPGRSDRPKTQLTSVQLKTLTPSPGNPGFDERIFNAAQKMS